MAAAFTLQLRTDQAMKAILRLKEKAPNAIARSLNRAAGSARTVMVREIARDIGLKQGTVREQLVTREARPDKLHTTIEASGKQIPLIDLGASGPEPSRGKGRGVSYRNPGRGGRVRIPNAFIATMRSGHRGVFKRVTQARLPITELHGPSLPRVFEKHMPAAIARGEEQLVKNLEHEFKFAMQQAAQAA